MPSRIFTALKLLGNMDSTLALYIYPITSDTEYLGGIDISICVHGLYLSLKLQPYLTLPYLTLP